MCFWQFRWPPISCRFWGLDSECQMCPLDGEYCSLRLPQARKPKKRKRRSEKLEGDEDAAAEVLKHFEDPEFPVSWRKTWTNIVKFFPNPLVRLPGLPLFSSRISGCKVHKVPLAQVTSRSHCHTLENREAPQWLRWSGSLHQKSSKVELQQQETYLNWQKRWGRLGSYWDFVQRHTSLDAELVAGMWAAGCVPGSTVLLVSPHLAWYYVDWLVCSPGRKATGMGNLPLSNGCRPWTSWCWGDISTGYGRYLPLFYPHASAILADDWISSLFNLGIQSKFNPGTKTSPNPFGIPRYS